MSSLIAGVFFLFLFSAARAAWNGAPWVPTRTHDLQHIITYLRQEPFSSFVDLGAGTGTVLFALHKQQPSATYLGYDISLLPLLIGTLHRLYYGWSKVRLVYKDLYQAHLENVDVVYIFLMPGVHTTIAKRVLSRTKPEARILFEGWPPEGYEPETVLRHEKCLPVYIFRGKTFHSAT